MSKREQMQKALLDARAICDAAESENRDFTADERTKVAAMLADAKQIKAEIQAEIQAAEGDKALREMIAGFEADMAGGKRDPGHAALKGTLGERFVNSPEFTAWLKQVAPSGRVSDKAALVSPPVEFKSLLKKDLVTGDSVTSAGAFVQTDYSGIYEPLGRYETSVLDLVNRRTTASDLVEFVRQTTKVQQAAPVAEANVTTYSGATGEVSGEKPEATIAFEKVQEPVKTIAVWIPATRRALSDASQIRGIIDQELYDDLREELEDQILNGDGVGENFTGLVNTAGILTQAWNTDLLTTSRQAITTLQVTGLARPTAWVIHPSDWETFDLLQDAQDRYYWGGPMAQGRLALWNVPVVLSQSLDQGSAILGDWRKAILWDREQSNIQVSNSHEDFFIRNMVAILAEMRAAFGVIRPTGFVIVDLESGS